MVREVNLVGVGMGNPVTLTLEAQEAIGRSGLLVGASRLLEPFADGGQRLLALVRTEEIEAVLREAGEREASVLFSGDIGFYSGAAALAERLAGMDGLQVRGIPGISSVEYLCARVLVPWQDAHLVSAHGRECDIVGEVQAHGKVFLLTGGATKVQDACASLVRAGLGQLRVVAGERLSYADELIVRGTAAELAKRTFGDLAVMLVQNETNDPTLCLGRAPGSGTCCMLCGQPFVSGGLSANRATGA